MPTAGFETQQRQQIAASESLVLHSCHILLKNGQQSCVQQQTYTYSEAVPTQACRLSDKIENGSWGRLVNFDELSSLQLVAFTIWTCKNPPKSQRRISQR